jgi:hypothetical protein
MTTHTYRLLQLIRQPACASPVDYIFFAKEAPRSQL